MSTNPQLNLKGIHEFIDNLEIAKLTNRDYHSHVNVLFKLLPNNPISSIEILKSLRNKTCLDRKDAYSTCKICPRRQDLS